MAIFGNKTVVENTETGDYGLDTYEGAMPTMESSDQMMLEFAEDIYKIQAGLYVSDVVIEQTITTEGFEGEPEALVEGVFADMFNKIREALRKLWSKLTAWFTEVRRYLEVMFTQGEKFITKYEKEIKERAGKASNYTYSGYHYAIDKVDAKVKSAQSAVDGKLAKIEGFSGKSVEDFENHFGDLGKMSTVDFSSSLAKELSSGAKSISDVKSDIIYLGRGNSEKTETFKNFDGNKPTEMITFVKGYKTALGKIDEDKKATDKRFNELIKGYNGLEKSLGENRVPGVTSVINRATANARVCLSVTQNVASCRQQIYKEAYHTYMRALRGLLTYNAAKESFEPEFDETGSSTSILESAMRLI